MNELTRRDFTRAAGVATALGYSRILGANDRVRVGYIGVGNRGDQVHDAFLEHGDNQTVAVCDLREDYMDFAVKKSRANPNKYKDYRKLLEDKEIDAVAISTPDHWHALMFIDACNAGKDVYVEKPMSLTVVEGRKMVETAERTKRVVQVGIHRRSAAFLKEAADFVRSGGIGRVTVAKGYHLRNEWPRGIGNIPDQKPPSEWEWDQWLGPAPKVPYNKNRNYYRFRWFYHYSGGQLTNFGVHYADMLRWCLGVDAPRAVTALGGKYAIRDNREIPDTLEVLWEFDGPTLMVFTQYNASAAPSNLQDSAGFGDGAARHQGHDVPPRRPLGSRAGGNYRQAHPRPYAAGSGHRAVILSVDEAGDGGSQRARQRRHRLPCPQLPGLRQEPCQV
jgi:predicted dehydrogenase